MASFVQHASHRLKMRRSRASFESLSILDSQSRMVRSLTEVNPEAAGVRLLAAHDAPGSTIAGHDDAQGGGVGEGAEGR